MSLPKGYDIKLDRVEDIGISNRRLWVYKLKFGKKQRHKKICVDFDGKLGNFSDPANFDARTASDNNKFVWDGFKTKDIRVGTDPSKTVKKTFVCLKTKGKRPVKIGAGGEIELRFVGPANGKAGKVSFHTQSVLRIKDSNRLVLKDITFGEKESVEVPIAMAEADTTEVIADTEDGIVAALDLETVLDPEAAALGIEEIAEAPLKVIAGLSAKRWGVLSEALEVSTVEELLEHEAIRNVTALRDYL